MSILQVKNLRKRFDGVHAIDGLSISIEEGHLTSIIGPNGSGKTTLINVISGMFPFEEGAIVLDDVSLAKISPTDVPAYGLTRTFQNVRLFEPMPVADNILVVLTERNAFGALFERHSKLHLEKVEEILKQVGLYEKRHELAINLSYGQRKLLEIGRVLAMDSKIILLDEPFAGLFPEMIKRVVGLINHMKSVGKTIILIEHNMNLIRELSDHCIVMDAGKLLAQGKPEEVLARRDVIEAYLGE